ncbi:MAG: hypothetical protein HY737_05010 [Candidatus Omnitrophica bacterium]|nr:hypothetical protein [Candidatus Omnitrophota bacterium]
MHRTTIMLPSTLKSRALQHAEGLGISLGEFIRRSIDAATHQRTTKHQPDSLFADEAVFRGAAPRDLSRHHDRYLYGPAET